MKNNTEGMEASDHHNVHYGEGKKGLGEMDEYAARAMTVNRVKFIL